MDTSVDVLIAGGGPVGAFLGLSLGNASLSVMHVDGVQPGAERPIALSHGSRLLLEARGVFRHIAYTPIKTIRVSQRGAFGRVLISAQEHKLPALGYVADYGSIRTAINGKTAPYIGRVGDWSVTEEGVEARVIDGQGRTQDIRAQLLVLADGASESLSPDARGSPVPPVTHDYAQSAIVAQVRTEAHHQNTAHERFTSDGPLALLPNRDGFALVWCVNRDAAPDLLQTDEKSFLLKLRNAFGSHLGGFIDVGQRTGFPLSLRYLKADLGPRVLAIGNAAQSLHPVAGQGLNLGLRDAWELASHLLDRPALIAQSEFARDFMGQRRADRRLEIGLTDSLVRVFSRQHAWLAPLRGAALLAIDTIPPARRLLARTMMYGLRSNRR
jgi:2-octaprenyl-6-methoxyphenol hydroxylase